MSFLLISAAQLAQCIPLIERVVRVDGIGELSWKNNCEVRSAKCELTKMATVGGYVPIHELDEWANGTSIDPIETLLPLLLSHDEAAAA